MVDPGKFAAQLQGGGEASSTDDKDESNRRGDSTMSESQQKQGADQTPMPLPSELQLDSGQPSQTTNNTPGDVADGGEATMNNSGGAGQDEEAELDSQIGDFAPQRKAVAESDQRIRQGSELQQKRRAVERRIRSLENTYQERQREQALQANNQPQKQNVFGTDFLGVSGTRRQDIRASTPRASDSASLGTTTLGTTVDGRVADARQRKDRRTGEQFGDFRLGIPFTDKTVEGQFRGAAETIDREIVNPAAEGTENALTPVFEAAGAPTNDEVEDGEAGFRATGFKTSRGIGPDVNRDSPSDLKLDTTDEEVEFAGGEFDREEVGTSGQGVKMGGGPTAEELAGGVGGVVRGVGDIINIPRIAVETDELGELGGFLVKEELAGRGPESRKATVEAGEQLIDVVKERAAEEPLTLGGRIGGSLLASGGLVKAASGRGRRSGRAVQFAIQPGEEIAKAGGRGGIRAVRGLDSADSPSDVTIVRDRGGFGGGGDAPQQLEQGVNTKITADDLSGFDSRSDFAEVDPDALSPTPGGGSQAGFGSGGAGGGTAAPPTGFGARDPLPRAVQRRQLLQTSEAAVDVDTLRQTANGRALSRLEQAQATEASVDDEIDDRDRTNLTSLATGDLDTSDLLSDLRSRAERSQSGLLGSDVGLDVSTGLRTEIESDIRALSRRDVNQTARAETDASARPKTLTKLGSELDARFRTEVNTQARANSEARTETRIETELETDLGRRRRPNFEFDLDNEENDPKNNSLSLDDQGFKNPVGDPLNFVLGDE